MKKILVTGCQGFIGSELVRQLIKHNKVIGIDDLSSSLINKDLKNKNFLFIKGRCQDPKIINKIKGKIDFIYHLAGQSSGEKSYNNTGEDLEKNTLTTVKLLEFALKKKCKRFIYASSMCVYGNSKIGKENEKCEPISFYGLSKLTSENYIKKFKKKGVDFTIVRLFNVYGKNQKLNNLKQGILRIYLTQLSNKNHLIVKGSKNRFRDFIRIEKVVNLMIKIPKISNTKNEIINFGTGKRTYIRDIIKLLKTNIKKKFTVTYTKGTPDDQFGIISNIKKMKMIFNDSSKFDTKKDISEVIKKFNL